MTHPDLRKKNILGYNFHAFGMYSCCWGQNIEN